METSLRWSRHSLLQWVEFIEWRIERPFNSPNQLFLVCLCLNMSLAMAIKAISHIHSKDVMYRGVLCVYLVWNKLTFFSTSIHVVIALPCNIHFGSRKYKSIYWSSRETIPRKLSSLKYFFWVYQAQNAFFGIWKCSENRYPFANIRWSAGK